MKNANIMRLFRFLLFRMMLLFFIYRVIGQTASVVERRPTLVIPLVAVELMIEKKF